ncbi:MAG: hypothetical protein JST96_18880, partial [Bacteroidetes bacterium]|nr:hypothetical protein [Bacteroidota bacterium]
LSYRKLLGSLVNIYELQAVPGWDIEIIKQVIPFVFAGDTVSLIENFKKRFHRGENNLLFRFGQQLEKAKGFKEPSDSTSSHYFGSMQQIFFRYKYNYKNLLQYGLVGDKDAGEQFFRGKQKYGFDFYSFHLYAKDIGVIKSLAIGDFAVNMGQGLIQWQSLAFTKSADVVLIKRQSTTLRPYNSAGEFNFHRGAGITLGKGKFETTLFGSYRNISANLAADTIAKTEFVTSFETSGYHRTQNENADRNELRQITIGGNFKITGNNYRLGINAVHYNFSYPIEKQDQPYNFFALRGKTWVNESIDYSYTFHNIHFFGEAAMDKKSNPAFVNGILMSLSASVDISVLYRKISKAYQSLYSDAFTENATVNNETGIYAGISIHPTPA